MNGHIHRFSQDENERFVCADCGAPWMDDAVWNAAIEAAVGVMDAAHDDGTLSASKWMGLTERLCALKRGAK